MKKRNSLAILCSSAFILSLAIAGCTSKKKSNSGSSADSGDAGTTFTVTFDSQGGSAVASQTVSYGEKATKPSDPTKEGYTFGDWYEEAEGVTKFDFDTPIKSNWTLYAKWLTGGGTTSESESQTSEETSSQETSSEISTHGHGPEGSTLANWYLCGVGSLWGENGWEPSGGVQLFTNPAAENDKGCILELPLEAGDYFKVTDTNKTSWYGYDKVKTEGTGCVGASHFEGVNDGYDGQNIKCKVSGTFDFYINGEGQFWIQLSNVA